MSEKESLLKKRIHIYDDIDDSIKGDISKLGEAYSRFISAAKTEREAVRILSSGLADQGFIPMEKATKPGKVYMDHLGKSLAAFVPGRRDIRDGLNIIVGHIDSPRLDLKPSPLYEDQQLAFFKTHYYGGIKKYQWLSRPLAIHGVIFLADGSRKDVVLGEDEEDPVFTIADLLPHLAGKAQMDKKANEFIEAEKLNLLIGSEPENKEKDGDDQRVRRHVMKILADRYGIREEDFISADLEVVPAGRARDIGLDRSLIGAYGHDDRVCSWAGYNALCRMEEGDRPSLLLLLDKEEIGSAGASGAHSWILEMMVGRILALYNQDSYSAMRDCLSRSACLSADVNAAVHPDYISVHDKLNAAWLNEGVVLTKYTGVRGKSGASEANAEFIAALRGLFGDHNIRWQSAELGRTDEGGGGTIALFMAYYGMQVVDLGIGLLDMHSPFEIASKADLYMMEKAFHAFFNTFSGVSAK